MTDQILLVGGVVGAISLICGAFVKLFQAIWKIFKRMVTEAVDQSELAHYTKHMLGPNGDTPPIWRRVIAIENHVGVNPYRTGDNHRGDED